MVIYNSILKCRLLSVKMSEAENNEAINDIYSTGNWAIFFMYKLFIICHCCHTTVDEVCYQIH